MQRFGDKPQNWWMANVDIGFFEIRADPADIKWSGNYMFCFETKAYVEEQTGTARGERFGFLEPIAGKRYVRMAEWTIKGCGTCPCDKNAN